MVTIYDIARETGFSPATVSKALNNYAGVNKKTSERIMRVARDMGYTANVNARALVTKKSWLIGVLFSEDVGTGISHPHFSGILQSFQSRVGERGYDVIFVNRWLGDKKVSYLEHCLLRRVDGVMIAATKLDNNDVQSVVGSNLKLVSVEMPYANRYSIISDNKMGSLQALEYLYFLGHRKIAHIAAPLYSTAGMERCDAYKQFIEEKGLEFKPNYIVEAPSYSPDAGRQAIDKLVSDCWNDMPTAIYIAYDELACSAMSFLQERGFRIPKDLSIVGFDNLEAASYTNPGLTTINQERMTIGKNAADMLISMIEGKPQGKNYDIRIPTSLVIRGSCRRID